MKRYSKSTTWVSKAIQKACVMLMLVYTILCTNGFAAGTPGEVLLSDQWRSLYAYYSPLTNPAFMTERMYTEARFVAYLPHEAMGTVFEAGLIVPLGLYQSAGGTWVGQQDAKVVDDIFQTSHQFSSNNFTLSYAINPWDRLSFGANINISQQNIFDSTGTYGYGIDGGLSYHLLNPFWGKNVFGITYLNLLGQQQAFVTTISKSDPLYIPQESGFASQLKIFHHIEVKEGVFENNIQFSLTDFTAPAAVFKNGAKSPWALAEHVIFRFARIFSFHAIAGLENAAFSYAGVGLGFNFPTLSDGRDLEAMYQFRNAANTELAQSSSIYARAQMGPHREEVYAHRMASQMDATPADLYNKALTLYSAQKYWDAFFIFNRIIRQFPDFFKNDWVSYYSHSCQEKLDMRKIASAGYAEVINGYQSSTVMPYAALGALRIAYREGDNEAIDNQFKTLFQITVPDSLRFHAAYIMGQTYMNQQYYSRAVQMFMLIPPQHPVFLFAQHSMAVAAMNNGNKEEARRSLENCAGHLNEPGQTIDQKEIINRSLVLLGYLFYENGFMSKAVTALRLVPITSYYYEDALLGLGWAALKSAQWTDCVAAAKSLQRVSQRPLVIADGILLEAYSASVNNDWVNSVALLRNGQKLLETANMPSDDSLAAKRRTYVDDRFTYDKFSRDVLDVSRASVTSTSPALIDSLHQAQIEMKKTLSKFTTYADEFERTRLFNRTLADVKQDINYALIIAERKTSTTKSDKEGDATAKEQQNVDKEIEKVQKQMQDLKSK